MLARLLTLVGSVFCLVSRVTIRHLCEHATLELIYDIICNGDLSDPQGLSRFLLSTHYDFSTVYVKCRETPERLLRIQQLFSEASLHETIHDIRKIQKHAQLKSWFTTINPESMVLTGKNFIPDKWTFEQRLVLLRRFVQSFPRGLECYKWQRRLLKGLSGTEQLELLVLGWDILNQQKIYELVSTLLDNVEMEQFVDRLIEGLDPEHALLRLLRFTHVVLVVTYNKENPVMKTATLLLDRLHGWVDEKVLNSVFSWFKIQLSATDLVVICNHLIGHHGRDQRLQPFIIDQMSDILQIMKAQWQKGDGLSEKVAWLLSFKHQMSPVRFRKMQLSVWHQDLSVHMHSWLDQMNAVSWISTQQREWFKWQRKARKMLRRGERGWKVKQLADDSITLAGLHKISQRLPMGKVLLNALLPVPTRITAEFPTVTTLPDLLCQFVRHVHSTDLLFQKTSTGELCWDQQLDLKFFSVYLQAIPYLLDRGERIDMRAMPERGIISNSIYRLFIRGFREKLCNEWNSLEARGMAHSMAYLAIRALSGPVSALGWDTIYDKLADNQI